jgi:hypothetical protein
MGHGQAFQDKKRSSLVLGALTMAMWGRRPKDSVIID